MRGTEFRAKHGRSMAKCWGETIPAPNARIAAVKVLSIRSGQQRVITRPAELAARAYPASPSSCAQCPR